MRRLLFLMICVLCVFVKGYAQIYNVTVKNSEGKPLKGVLVFTTPTKAKGELVFKELKAQQFLENKDNLMAEGKTDEDGYCSIECSSVGAVILDGGDVLSGIYGIQIYHVEKYRKSEVDIDLEFVLTGKEKTSGKRQMTRKLKDASEYSEFSLGGETEELQEVTKRATPLMQGPGDGVAERHGRNKIRITKELEINGEYARDNARFVAFPYVVFEETKDSVNYMPPSVVDGKDYSRSMVRRMSFQPSRDKLDEFRFDHSMQMQDHNAERFLYSEWANITKGTKYHVPGILWYEDYNGVYHRDSILFSDGKEREPMRFLNWSDARNLVYLERERFFKKGRFEAIPDNKAFNLNFEQGKPQLNLRDSATVSERDRMLSWLTGKNKDGSLNKIVIRGYSSPEGSEKRNRELSRSRAETIRSLLRGYLPSVSIETKFDEYDNIVPWQKVADVMTAEMDDSVAHTYAVQIRNIIADKEGFDAQYRAIRANKELYDYIDKNVLDRIRVVEIEASIVVRRVLEDSEVIERYERNDSNFRLNMLPYQDYIVMCYLADKEKWDELYDVSKLAYTKYAKEREIQKQFAVPGKKDTLQYINTSVPYPLAGYYYAVSTLRKGMMDLSILRPYLDDGAPDRGMPERPEINGLPFIVTQVLMYCQDEDFAGANNLIKKYRLLSYPQLKGLIMFVRCLDGQYRGKENEDVRQYVMATSEMNKAVIYTALGQYREALEILYSDDVPKDDAKVEYMKAICHFRLLNSNMTGLEVDGLPGSAMYRNPEEDLGSDDKSSMNTSAWAAPMLNALRMDKENVKYLENDGYFNNAYRQMVMYFWKRLQMGVPIEKVVVEYNALVAQMRKNKAQQKQN